ncbi:AaceriADL003WAp [[Ashbya] aceris (nom. inval.)]|nr:AaceriADL003WAp [[Ashbya] aceris (nom. inval.)]
MTIDPASELSTKEFLEAFQKLKEGEETADRMEKMLNKLEGNIEALLAAAEELNKSDTAGSSNIEPSA